MKKNFLIIVLFSLYSFAYGQVTINKKIIVLPGKFPCINIEICDAETGSLLEGATVKLVLSPGDTIKITSDKFGSINYNKKFPKDSVNIIINYLGYKELRYIHKITQPQIFLVARLNVDPIAINSIIIRGDRIAMVIRGDTTIYNASVFKTMDGDPMVEMLKKLPGIEIKNNNIYANGQIIKRVLVNGMSMFSDNTKSAVELLKTNEIEKIKVYEQFSDKDIALGDTLKPKDRIMDVTTKKKISIIKRVYFQLLYGKYLDENNNGKFDNLYSTQGQFDRHMVGNNLIAMLGCGEKSSFSGTPTGKFDKEISGLLNWIKSSKNYKYNFQTSTIFSQKKNLVYSGTEKEYIPNNSYISREELSENNTNNSSSGIISNNELSYKINKRHKISMQLNITDNHNRFDNSVYNTILLNGETMNKSNMERLDRKGDISLSYRCSYDFSIGKPKRNLNLKISASSGSTSGNGWSIDTLVSSTQKIFLINDNNSRNYTLKGEITYTEPLTLKSQLLLQYLNENVNSTSKMLSVDRFTGSPDQMNTFYYTQNFTAHKSSAKYVFNGTDLNINIGLNLSILSQSINKKLPEYQDKDRTYTNLTPNLLLKYSKMPYLLEINYFESITFPYIEQLAGIFNSYDAPSYSIGNQALKETRQQTVNLKYSITDIKTFSVLMFNFNTEFYRNAVILKEYFFQTPAIIPKYGDFEFPAGSTLQTMENSNGRFSISINAKYSSQSKLLQSKVSTSLNYSYDRIPYYTQEILYNSNIQSGGLNLEIISNFSEKVELILLSSINFILNERNNNKKLKRIKEYISGNIRWNCIKRGWINTNGSFQVSNTTLSGTFFKEFIVNTELLYKIGKNSNGDIILGLNDIFNQHRSFNVLMKNDYIETQRMSVLGTNLFLKLRYSF